MFSRVSDGVIGVVMVLATFSVAAIARVYDTACDVKGRIWKGSR